MTDDVVVGSLRRRPDDCAYYRSCACADASHYPTIEFRREVIKNRIIARQIADKKPYTEPDQSAE